MEPKVSVILPVRNEALRIRQCLNSILAQDFPAGQYEIIVVDGMSEDATRSIVSEFKRSHPCISVFDNPKKIVTTALNIAIARSRGEFIIRCDAHAEYAPDYISSCVAVAEQTGAANVGGHMRALPSGKGAVAHAIMLAHYSKFGLGGGRFHDPNFEGYVDTVWLGCYRREVLKSLGGYNDFLPRSEDIDLNSRLRKAGHRCYLSSRIRAFYYCRADLKGLFMQRWRDGVGVIQTIPVNRAAVGLRHLVPVFFVSTIVILASRLFSCTARLLLFCELLLYSAVSLYCTIQFLFIKLVPGRTPQIGGVDGTPVTGRFPTLTVVLLPLVFGVLHISYGMGSLFSLLTLPGFLLRYRRAQARRAWAPQ